MECFREGLSIAVDFAIILGIVFATITFFMQLQTMKKEHCLKTIEFFNEINNVTGDIVRQIRRLTEDVISAEEIINDEKLEDEIIKYLNLTERVAIGVNEKIFDIEIFDKMAGRSAIHTYKQLSEYIKYSREIKKPTNPKRYEEFEHMVIALKKLRKEE